MSTTLWISQSRLKSRIRKSLSKDYMNYKDYDSFEASDCLQHKSGKWKALPMIYNDDDLFVASPMNQKHADHYHVTLRLRRPPKFISCLNGTLFCVLNNNNSQKILDMSRKDLEDILILQGQFCSKRLWQMSKVFTHNTREQALLQGPKALKFVKKHMDFIVFLVEY